MLDKYGILPMLKWSDMEAYVNLQLDHIHVLLPDIPGHHEHVAAHDEQNTVVLFGSNWAS